MSIVDLIIKFDSNSYLKEVLCVGDIKEWFENNTWEDFIGQNIDHLLDKNINRSEGIVEIKNRFFKYQLVKEFENSTLYLSHDGFNYDLYKQAINHLSEGIQIYDKNGYFLYANNSSEKLENYNYQDYKGKHLLDLYNVSEDFSTILTVLRTKKSVSNRCDRFKDKHGKSLITINSGYPLELQGKMYGAVVFENDLSSLKLIRKRASHLETYLDKRKSVKYDTLYTFDDIIHSSKSMDDIIHFAKKISFADSSVLIVGDTGTGKELIAQSIHSFSSRGDKNFIDVNCSAVPINLFESMFFGTEKGAFTGSTKSKGFFEMAHEGTIFLDEVNSMSSQMQAKLLRVIQEKRFQRIGGHEYIKCDVRIIAATNKDPLKLIEQNKMRSDFYYRISTIKINIPQLYQRKEDILILIDYFLKNLCRLYNKSNVTISQDVVNIFLDYNWPGNIRELQNVVEYCFFNCTSDEEFEITVSHLPDYLICLGYSTNKSIYTSKDIDSKLLNSGSLKERLEILEKEIIIQTIKLNNKNITKSAQVLGMSRQSLQYRIRKNKIK